MLLLSTCIEQGTRHFVFLKYGWPKFSHLFLEKTDVWRLSRPVCGNRRYRVFFELSGGNTYLLWNWISGNGLKYSW